MPGTAVVIGARNLGGAIIDHLNDRGWRVAGIARSEETLEQVRARRVLAIQADASDPRRLRDALARAADELSPPSLVVNAASAAKPPEGETAFGGGPVVSGTLAGMRGWSSAVSEQAFVFLSEGARALTSHGGGTLIQVTGGSSRRAMPGRGMWSAGAQATRALTQAAAQELREQGVHVALLVVDARIDQVTSPGGPSLRGPEGETTVSPSDSLADQALIAQAVEFLAAQEPRALTHELVVTPAGDRWVP
jgi:NAD(P)-dependent dehydrogenase (short-subunit alcohol dehydrogenase family)